MKKKPGKWALCWDQCQKHGGSDRAHMAKGLCTMCWQQERKAGTLGRGPSVPAPQQPATRQEEEMSEAAPRWHYQYACCKGCGSTTRPHHGDGNCTECAMLASGMHPGLAARTIADNMADFGVPHKTEEQERLKGVLARKFPEGHIPITILPPEPVWTPLPVMPARDIKADPERGGLVNPANPPPAWVFRDKEHEELFVPLPEEVCNTDGEIGPGVQIGGFVDEQGQPVPTAPVVVHPLIRAIEEAVEEQAVYNEVRYKLTANPAQNVESAARQIVPYDGIDRSLALADFTTEQLLSEINSRFAAMQRQWQESSEVASRYARIAAIMEGK